jgi:predicted PurR-regulated permease PerM
MNEEFTRKLKLGIYISLAVIIFFFVIIIAKGILIPLSLAYLFATLIYPLVIWLKRLRFPNTLAILTSVLLFIGLIFLAFNFFFQQMQGLLDDLPVIREKALLNLQVIRQTIEDTFGISSEYQHTWVSERIQHLFDSSSNFTKNAFNATAGTVFKLLLIPVFMFYLINSRDRYRGFIAMILPSGLKPKAEDLMSKMSNVSQHYIQGVFIVILILCVLNTLGLYIIGLKYAMVFGVLSALFNVIPYFGNWIGASLPLLFALLTGETPSLFFGVLLVYIIIQFIEHNILTPNITGGNVLLNPLVTIVGIIIGEMVWGVAGMLIVIPAMASLKILFQNVDSLKPLAHVLGSEEPHHKAWLRKLKERWSRQ